MEQIGPVYKSDTILTESSNAYSKQSITNLKLNHVKRIQYSVIKHTCKIIYMISENRTIPWVLCKIQPNKGQSKGFRFMSAFQ